MKRPARMRLGSLAAAIAATLLRPAAAAPPVAAAPEVVPTVDIVGIAPLHGLGVERKLLPYQVQVAGERAIRQAGGENLGEFMARSLGGINVNEVSGSPFQNDITFRGFRASPVLGSAQGISVYLDGVRVNEPFGDVVNWDMVPESAIGDLLLVPGANPLYGLNTLGGALAFGTKSGLSHPGVQAELSVSSHGRRRADLAHGARGAGGWHSFVGATLFDDAGWRDHSAGRLANVLLKFGRAHGATDWSASLLGGRSRLRGNGLLPESLYRTRREAAYTFPDTTRNRLLQGTLNLMHRLGSGGELSAIAYARDSRRDTVNGDISADYDDYVQDCAAGFDSGGAARDPGACSLTQAQGAALHPGELGTTRTRQQSHGASAAFSARRGTLRVDAGMSFDASAVDYAQFGQAADITPEREVIGDPGAAREAGSSVVGSARAFGAYALGSWALSPAAQLTASARFNRAQVANTLTTERGPQPAERFTYTRLNPALGITHMLGAGITGFANIAQGNRVPTVIELGCADPANPCRLPVGLQADPYLKQVVARTIEAGLRGQAWGARYSLSLHRTVKRDDILFLSSGPTRQGYFSNFARTRHQGVDATLERQFGRLGMRMAYNYLEAVYDAEGELFTGARNVQVGRGTRLAGLPRHSAKLALDWKAGADLGLGADLQGVSSLVTQGNEDGLVEDGMPGEAARRADWRVRGHALLSLRANYRPAANWELFARVGNVLDRRYETYGAVAPDLFANGSLLKPHEGAVDARHARFVAPGAPRTIVAGVRYSF